MVATNTLRRGQSDDDYISQKYHDVVAPHVESFDEFIDEGITKALDSIEPARVRMLLRSLLLTTLQRQSE